MDFDPIAQMLLSLRPMTVHNVRLVEVRAAPDGLEVLSIEYEGSFREIPGGGRWNPEFSGRDVGRVGYLVHARAANSVQDLDISTRQQQGGRCYFRAYVDPSLRRVPALDGLLSMSHELTGGRIAQHGWYCDAKPGGFLAPAGLIPGQHGEFVADDTIAVTVRVPKEFVREAARAQLKPKALLESFIGDLAGVQNLVACPRADGYGSNGSDERNYAEAWLERAHGMNMIDLDELEERRALAHEEAAQRDELVALLEEYTEAGGDPQDLISAVQAIVDRENEGT